MNGWRMADFPVIETERLTLRELNELDVPALFAIHSDAQAMKWFGTYPLTELAQAERLPESFRAWRSMPNPGTRWGIESKAERELVGTCGLFKWNRLWRSCTIGFELARSAQGQGMMRESVVACIRWGFRHMELNRIDAQVHPDNVGSLNLLEGVGFRREGLLRQAGYWRNAYHDLVQLSLLRAEFGGDVAA
jgi:ribosomal-protein-alanine N-acetyltransferase